MDTDPTNPSYVTYNTETSTQNRLFQKFQEIFSQKKIFSFGLMLLVGVAIVGGSLFYANSSHQTTTHAATNITEYLTTSDTKTVLQQSSGTFSNTVVNSPTTITVDDNKPYQQIEGFGASLTDTSSYLLENTSYRNQLMQQLFDPTNGLGITILRQPIGASDFTVNSYYSLDDIPCAANPSTTDDSNLQCFSISRDEENIIPIVKQALQINPNIKIIATPWSPPAWMKTNNSLLGNVKDGNNILGGTLKTSLYTTYGKYLAKFVNTYQNQGIPVYALTVQNEPGLQYAADPGTNYPAMYMSPQEEAGFIQSVLTPTFLHSNGITSKILGYDWNTASMSAYMTTLRPVPGIIGTAFHCYRGYPSSSTTIVGDFYEDECSTSISNSYASSSSNPLAPIDALIDGMRRGSKTGVFWNFVEDQNNGPRPNNSTQGCTGCTPMIRIATTNNQPTGTPEYLPEYYAMQQMSKFVKPGAYRIDSPTFDAQGLKDIAFKNPDGSIVLIVHNTASSVQPVIIGYHGQGYVSSLPAGGMATYTWQSNPVQLPTDLQNLSKKWYFAEGYIQPNMTTKFTVFNPNATPAHVSVSYQTNSIGIITKTYTVPPLKPFTWNANNDISVTTTPGGFGTVITSDQPITAERREHLITSLGGIQIPGESDVFGATSPQNTWYFAEGATLSNLDEYLLIFNPSTQPAPIQLTYYTQKGTPLTKTFTIPAQKRQGIHVNDATTNSLGQSQPLGIGPNLNVSAKIVSNVPVVAERVMYFNLTNGNPGGVNPPATIPGADATVGATSLNTKFYFAEGATFANFNEYFSIFNPNTTSTQVTITYMPQGSNPVTRTLTVPATTRSTVKVWQYNASTNPGGLGQLNVSVGATVTSSQPILVERPLYFGFANQNSTTWTKGQLLLGGSSVIGSSQLGKTIVFGSGDTAMNSNEYISILNPNAASATLTVNYLTADGFTYTKNLTVPANKRQTITLFLPSTSDRPANLGSGTDTGGISVVLNSNIPIFAERPIYDIAPNENTASGSPQSILSGSDVAGVLLGVQ